jgi:hypothetical protein
MALRTHGRGPVALLAVTATAVAAAIAPVAAGAAVGVTITGDDGNPLPLGGALNIRNMNPTLAITATAPTDRWSVAATGPTGTVVSSDTGCLAGSLSPRSIDYVGNGAYTVKLTTFAADCATITGTQALPFTITASTTFGPPPVAALTRAPGSSVPNTVTLGIDLNPGALSTDAFYERGVPPNPDGSLPGTPEQVFPDPATRTVAIRLNKGTGIYYVAAHAKGFTGLFNAQAFGPWAPPAQVRTFAPFDLQRLEWTDSRGPSYRLSATIRATGANGRVNIAIRRDTNGRYRSFGTARIRSHRFSKRFRLTKVGSYRIRFKYKGNATVAAGWEVRRFRITRRVVFRSAVVSGAGGAVTRASALGG